MRKYERAYNELNYDRYYKAIPGLRKAVAGIDGFVTYDDEQVADVLEEFKGQGFQRTEYTKECISPYIISQMANWRKCKQIYDFDKTLYDELAVSPADRIPMDILSKMPYPIFYVRCPWDEVLTEMPSHIRERYSADWNYSEYMHTDGALVSYINGVLDIRFFSTSITEHTNRLTGETVTKSSNGIYTWGNTYKVDNYHTIGDLIAESVRDDNFIDDSFFTDKGKTPWSKAAKDILNKRLASGWDINGETKDIMHVLAAVIYIVSKEADTETYYVPQRGRKRKNKTDSLSSAEVTRVGYRIGRALGEARKAAESIGYGGDREAAGSRKVTPHMRRAHWHCYWIGSKDNPTDIVVHWLAPIMVNGGKGEAGTTVHEAHKSEGRKN